MYPPQAEQETGDDGCHSGLIQTDTGRGNEDRRSTDSAFCDDSEESNPDSPTSSDSRMSTSSADSGVSTNSADSNVPLIKDSGKESPIDDPERQTETDTVVKQPDNTDTSFWLKITVIFSVLDVLLLASIILVAFGIQSSDSSSTVPPGHCLNCMDVYLTTDDKLDNIYNFNITDDGKCCSENETLLIKKYVIKRYRSDVAKVSAERGFPERTAIHLDLDLNDENSKNEGSNQTLRWNHPELRYGNLSLSEDRTRIKVNRTGLYYISCKVVFDDNMGDIGKAGLDPMSLNVLRENGSGEAQLLLETKETHCANSRTKCAKPSSGQGVFKMEKGDSVVVKVTKPSGLKTDEKLNHFDMYLI